MTLLGELLTLLNAAVEEHNAKVMDAFDCERIDAARRDELLVPPGSVTVEKARAGPQEWPMSLRVAVHQIIGAYDPAEIVRMCDASPVQTETIRHLRIGSKKSAGMAPGDLHGMPVGIRLMDMAHLVAQSDAGKAVLLG